MPMICLKSALRHLPLVGALVFAALAGCASAGPPVPPRPPGPMELAGTKWKLVTSSNGLDGRTIEFKRGKGGYEGVVVELGRQLGGKTGAREGIVLLELAPTDVADSFKGIERVPGADEAEITCSVARDGGTMKCDVYDGPWVRTL